jgi:hypothetical protein
VIAVETVVETAAVIVEATADEVGVGAAGAGVAGADVREHRAEETCRHPSTLRRREVTGVPAATTTAARAETSITGGQRVRAPLCL